MNSRITFALSVMCSVAESGFLSDHEKNLYSRLIAMWIDEDLYESSKEVSDDEYNALAEELDAYKRRITIVEEDEENVLTGDMN